MNISTSDIGQVYANFGLNVDHSIRFCVRMKNLVDGGILEAAVRKTEQRYPYFSVRLLKNASEYFYEANSAPIVLLNTDQRINLNAAQTNYHVWAVCYKDDWIFLNFYHGIADGAGGTQLFATLLYYYCKIRYGVTDHKGIRTLEDPILPEETVDPLDLLPHVDFSTLTLPDLGENFSLIEDGGIQRGKTAVNFDIILPEKPFVKFSSENDGSPGTMLSLLFNRAIDAEFPVRNKPINTSYIINCRPMINFRETHHNCLSAAYFFFNDRLKKLPLATQMTIYRGITFLACEDEPINRQMTLIDSFTRDLIKNYPTLAAKKAIYGKILADARRNITTMVSYIGKWQFPAIGENILEFFVHAAVSQTFLVEISAVNGKIGVSVLQRFEDERIINAFFEQLENFKIPYELKRKIPPDIAYFPEP